MKQEIQNEEHDASTSFAFAGPHAVTPGWQTFVQVWGVVAVLNTGTRKILKPNMGFMSDVWWLISNVCHGWRLRQWKCKYWPASVLLKVWFPGGCRPTDICFPWRNQYRKATPRAMPTMSIKVPGPGDTVVTKTDKFSAFMKLTVQEGRPILNQ